MGLNISVVEFDHDGYPVDVDWFDGLRHAGDREFIWTKDFEWEYVRCEHDTYKRPKNFDEARAWVRNNICEENQPRLLEALDEMEYDAYWFYAST